MESSSKKIRTISKYDEEENEEDEEMEKFYALIKSLREARDCFINTSAPSDDDQTKTKKRKLQADDDQVVVWKPSFQREDFMKDAELFKKHPLPVSVSAISPVKEGAVHQQKNEEGVKDDQLDLSLSL